METKSNQSQLNSIERLVGEICVQWSNKIEEFAGSLIIEPIKAFEIVAKLQSTQPQLRFINLLLSQSHSQ